MIPTLVDKLVDRFRDHQLKPTFGAAVQHTKVGPVLVVWARIKSTAGTPREAGVVVTQAQVKEEADRMVGPFVPFAELLRSITGGKTYNARWEAAAVGYVANIAERTLRTALDKELAMRGIK